MPENNSGNVQNTGAARRIPEFISSNQASRLLESGEWITNTKLHELVGEVATELLRMTPLVNQGNPTVEQVELAFEAVAESCAVEFEHKVIKEDVRLSSLAEVRISADRVYKIKATAIDSFFEAVKLLGCVTAAIKIPGALTSAGAVGQAWKTIQSLIKGYEKIVDPHEQLVFETVCKLQGKAFKVNYDADKDRNNANARARASTAELVATLQGRLSKDEVEKILAALDDRGVITCKDNSWRVIF